MMMNPQSVTIKKTVLVVNERCSVSFAKFMTSQRSSMGMTKNKVCICIYYCL